MTETSSGHHHLRFKTFVMILLVVIFSPVGNVLLGKGMKDVGPLAFGNPADAVQTALKIFTSPFIGLGIASLILFCGLHAGALVGGLQLRAAGRVDCLRRRGRARAFRAARTGGTDTLGRSFRDLRGCVRGGTNAAAHDGAPVKIWETIELALIVVCGTAGELCVTRAMKSSVK